MAFQTRPVLRAKLHTKQNNRRRNVRARALEGSTKNNRITSAHASNTLINLLPGYTEKGETCLPRGMIHGKSKALMTKQFSSAVVALNEHFVGQKGGGEEEPERRVSARRKAKTPRRATVLHLRCKRGPSAVNSLNL